MELLAAPTCRKRCGLAPHEGAQVASNIHHLANTTQQSLLLISRQIGNVDIVANVEEVWHYHWQKIFSSFQTFKIDSIIN